MREILALLSLRPTIVLAGFFLGACAGSERISPQSVAQPGAAWTRNLNEPPPMRQQDGAAIAETKSSLNAAREKAIR